MPSRLILPPQTRQPITDRQAGFAGGLNTISDPAYLSADQARQMTNFRLTTYGAATKRLGTQHVSVLAFAKQPRRALYWPTKGVLIWGGGGGTATSMYKCGTTIPATATALTTNNTAQAYPIDLAIFSDGTNEKMYVASADSLLYGSVTTTSLQSTDAVALSGAIASVPSLIDGLTVYNSRLWGWASGLNNKLYYSNLSTATASIGGDSLGIGASGGGVILITTFGASNIVAALPVGASLLIFHQRGVSRLTGFGQSDITVAPQALAADVGLWSRTAIDEYNGVAYLVTPRGLYTATENKVAPVATPDRPDPLGPILKTISPSANGVIVRFNRDTSEVWVSIDGIGVYIYNTVLQAWAGPFVEGIGSANDGYGAVQCLVEVVDVNGFPHLWTGIPNSWFVQCDAAGLYLDRLNSDGTGGALYTSTLQCHRMFGSAAGDAGSVPAGASLAKSWRMANVLATLDSGILSNVPTLASSSVYGGTNTVTFTTPSSTEKVYYNAAGGAGPYIDITITDASSGNGGHPGVYAGVEVTGYALGTR